MVHTLATRLMMVMLIPRGFVFGVLLGLLATSTSFVLVRTVVLQLVWCVPGLARLQLATE